MVSTMLIVLTVFVFILFFSVVLIQMVNIEEDSEKQRALDEAEHRFYKLYRNVANLEGDDE